MKKILIILFISVLMGQYDYSLEDINPSSTYYGNNVGTSFFEGKSTLHYFGNFSWLICTSRFEQLNNLYDELKEQGIAFELIGIGKDTDIGYSTNWTDGNDAAVCADESPFSIWSDWNASQRDIFLLDSGGGLILHQNISTGIPDDLNDLIISLSLNNDKRPLFPEKVSLYQNYPNLFSFYLFVSHTTY